MIRFINDHYVNNDSLYESDWLTVDTRKGRYLMREDEDGYLVIREVTMLGQQITVMPEASNAIKLSAVRHYQ